VGDVVDGERVWRVTAALDLTLDLGCCADLDLTLGLGCCADLELARALNRVRFVAAAFVLS